MGFPVCKVKPTGTMWINCSLGCKIKKTEIKRNLEDACKEQWVQILERFSPRFRVAEG